jgi:AbiV family abortive infection protein
MNLDEKILIDAVEKSIRNAEDLILDAELLQKNNRLPRAYTLYQLAMEEVGKAVKIYSSIIIGLPGTEKEKKDFLKLLRNHIDKAQSARILTFFVVGAVKEHNKELADQLIQWTLEETNDPEMLNDYKNYGLYTSFIDDGYKMPSEVITDGRVNYIEVMSKNRLAVAKAFVMSGLPHLDSLKAFVASNQLTENKVTEMMEKLITSTFS